MAAQDGPQAANVFGDDRQRTHKPVRQGRGPDGLGNVLVELSGNWDG
jgi:hypothetical protein